MGAKPLWNHDALFDYQDRYIDFMTTTGAPSSEVSWSSFSLEMWNTYRSSF